VGAGEPADVFSNRDRVITMKGTKEHHVPIRRQFIAIGVDFLLEFPMKRDVILKNEDVWQSFPAGRAYYVQIVQQRPVGAMRSGPMRRYFQGIFVNLRETMNTVDPMPGKFLRHALPAVRASNQIDANPT
jgi:hypothetical protein